MLDSYHVEARIVHFSQSSRPRPALRWSVVRTSWSLRPRRPLRRSLIFLFSTSLYRHLPISFDRDSLTLTEQPTSTAMMEFQILLTTSFEKKFMCLIATFLSIAGSNQSKWGSGVLKKWSPMTLPFTASFNRTSTGSRKISLEWRNSFPKEEEIGKSFWNGSIRVWQNCKLPKWGYCMFHLLCPHVLIAVTKERN